MRVDFVGLPVEDVEPEVVKDRLTHVMASEVEVSIYDILRPKELATQISSEVGRPSALAGGRLIITNRVSERNAAKYSPFKKWDVNITTSFPVASKEDFEAADDQALRRWVDDSEPLPEADAFDFDGFDDFDDFDDDDFDDEPSASTDVETSSPSDHDTLTDVTEEKPREEVSPEPIDPTPPATTVKRAPLTLVDEPERKDSVSVSRPVEDNPSTGRTSIFREVSQPQDDASVDEPITPTPVETPEQLRTPEPVETVSPRDRVSRGGDSAMGLLPAPAVKSGDHIVESDNEPDPKGGGEANRESDSLPSSSPASEPVSVIESHAKPMTSAEMEMSPSAIAAMQENRASRQSIGNIALADDANPTVRHGGHDFRVRKGHLRRSNVTYVTGTSGGVGKSTVTWLLSDASASIEPYGKKREVFLIEVDLKNAKFYSNLGITTGNNIYTFAADIMARKKANIKIDEVLVRQLLVRHSHKVQNGQASFYVLPAPYDVDESYDLKILESGVQIALKGIDNLECQVFLDGPELAQDNHDPFGAKLSGSLADHVVVVGGGGREHELVKTLRILSSSQRLPEDRKQPDKVHVIINGTQPSETNLDILQKKLAPFGVRAIIPKLNKYLSDDAALERSKQLNREFIAWVGSEHIPPEAKKSLRALAIYGLIKMGYYRMDGNSDQSLLETGRQLTEAGSESRDKKRRGGLSGWLRR